MEMGTRFALIFVFALSFASSANGQDGTSLPNIDEQGASLYRQYCTLCHGVYGMGDGVLPLTIKDYPETNLMLQRFGADLKSIRNMIHSCDSEREVAKECPPYENQLTEKEIAALSRFIVSMRAQPVEAAALVRSYSFVKKPTLWRGKSLFLVRCATCHGEKGLGDGRLARVLSPTPVNLTQSMVSGAYVTKIVLYGSKSMGRSASMPAFEGELDESQMQSIVLFLKSLRVRTDSLSLVQ